MNWFETICRDTGLMFHYIVHPDSKKTVVNEKVQQKQISPTVTLRRTTIDEIEVHQPKDPSKG